MSNHYMKLKADTCIQLQTIAEQEKEIERLRESCQTHAQARLDMIAESNKRQKEAFYAGRKPLWPYANGPMEYETFEDWKEQNE
jgi:hypothetical protein